jgi:hypothetical protein
MSALFTSITRYFPPRVEKEQEKNGKRRGVFPPETGNEYIKL